MPDLLKLHVWNRVLTGWKSVEIIDSIEALAPTFSLGYSDRCLDSDGTLRVSPGDLCTVKLDDDVVLTGFVDDSDMSESAPDRSLGVSGRSRTGDLVDCAALHKPTQWRNSTLDQIAADLCKPFEIAVKVAGSVGAAFPKFAIEPGETVQECLARAARERGRLLLSSPEGDLVIASIGANRAKTALQRGVNIKSAILSLSMAERFSEVRVRSQADDEDLFGKPAAQIEVKAEDPNVKRYRPLVIMDDAAQGSPGLKARANWEVSSRLGRGSRLTLTVPGWRHDGQAWRANTLVHVRHDWLGIDAEMLVASVKLTLDDGGMVTTLELCPVEAFSPEPVSKKKKENATWP